MEHILQDMALKDEFEPGCSSGLKKHACLLIT